MDSKYNSIYNGIIIQNNDKNHAGMVKVWVPSISPTVYDNFRNLDHDIKIKYLGINVKSDLNAALIEDLKIVLPWAPLGFGVINEGSTGRYNTRADVYNSGDGYDILDNNKNEFIFKNQNLSSLEPQSEKPGAIYENNEHRLKDAFTGDNRFINNINPYSLNYKPSTYSNKPKGELGIPNVGAHVAVQFFEGDPHFPFVTHMIYGKEDFDGLYDDYNYPGAYENTSNIIGEYNHNNDKYRSKYILNQKGGNIEIINTDHNEKMKFTHYSGSYKEFNNYTNTELAVNHDQKLVQGNQYATIRGYKNLHVGKDFDKSVLGDDYEKVGNLNWSAVEIWKNSIAELADNKQLFDIKRCNADNIIRDDDGDVVLKFNSKVQTKSGAAAPSPNIKDVKVLNAANNSISGTENKKIMISKEYKLGEDPASEFIVMVKESSALKPVPTGITEINPSSMDGAWAVEPLKAKIKQLYQEKIESLIDIEKKMGVGGSKIIHITKDKVETIGMVMNDFGSIRIDSLGKMYDAEMKINEHASFTYAKPSPLIEYVDVPTLPGGSYTLNVSHRYNVLVGAGGLNLKSYGATNICGTITNVSGEQVNVSAGNEVNINSDSRLTITADILVLRQKNQKQVLVDSSLGISKNVIIGGSTYIEGETFVHHITAPLEYQVTEPQAGRAGVPDSGATIIGYAVGKTEPSGTGPHTHDITLENVKVYIDQDNCIKVYDHSHIFPNLPLTLKTSSNGVRKAAVDNLKLNPKKPEEALEEALEDDKGNSTPLYHVYKGVKEAE